MLAGGKKQYYLDQEIALYLLGSGNNGRYYDATTGRFLSEDPTGEAGGDDNLYRYTGNDPINNLDPSGHKREPYQPPQTPPAQQPNAHVHTTIPPTTKGATKPKQTSTPGHPVDEHGGETGGSSHMHEASSPAFVPPRNQRHPRFLKGQNVKGVQKIVGTKQDGLYGPKTMRAVQKFQEMLIHDGFLPPKQPDGKTSADGKWGHETERAYEAYKKAHDKVPAPTEHTTATTQPATTQQPTTQPAKLPPVPKWPSANATRTERDRWVRQMAAYIDAYYKAHGIKGIDGKTLAAQFAVETNWGRSKGPQESYNLGNVKGKGPGGSYKLNGRTYRKYHRLGGFLSDYAKIIHRTYPQAIGKTGPAYYHALMSGRYKYASNKAYVKLLTSVYDQVFERSHR